MIVVDTMTVAYGLLPHPEFAPEVEQVREKDGTWAAPSVWGSEFRNVLLQYVRAVESGPLSQNLQLADAFGVMQDAEALLVDRTVQVDSESVLQLAYESGCSAYDWNTSRWPSGSAWGSLPTTAGFSTLSRIQR
jgi:hypothetical protein